MAEVDAGWHPPFAQELLEQAIPVGTTWYELRMPLKTISYTTDKWDSALQDTRALGKIFRGELYICYRDAQGLHAERAL